LSADDETIQREKRTEGEKGRRQMEFSDHDYGIHIIIPLAM